MEANVNWLAILVASLSSFVIGGLLYSKALFGKIWMREVVLTEAEIEKSNFFKIFGLTFVLTFIMATCLAFFFGGKVNVTEGMLYGGLTGLGWVSTAFGVIYLYEHKSFTLWAIHAGYNTITFIVMGAILGAWH